MNPAVRYEVPNPLIQYVLLHILSPCTQNTHTHVFSHSCSLLSYFLPSAVTLVSPLRSVIFNLFHLTGHQERAKIVKAYHSRRTRISFPKSHSIPAEHLWHIQVPHSWKIADLDCKPLGTEVCPVPLSLPNRPQNISPCWHSTISSHLMRLRIWTVDKNSLCQKKVC